MKTYGVRIKRMKPRCNHLYLFFFFLPEKQKSVFFFFFFASFFSLFFHERKYMYTCDTIVTINNISAMPRNRSLSASNTSSSPALISRGFASIRRAHRRLSTSSPITPPLNNQESTYDQSQESESQSVNKPRIRLVPNVGLSSRSFVFDIIDRELEPGVMYRIGRFSDRNSIEQRLSFKSKVVSRNHAELWTEQGKVYIF